MKNNVITFILYTFLSSLFFFSASSNEQFNFDITELEIIEDGNKFIGKKRGTATTDDGVTIEADNFNYDKILNILNASGNVIITDNINKSTIYTENITYLKNEEKIFTKNYVSKIKTESNDLNSNANDNNSSEYGKSKAIFNDVIIIANEFKYNKILNIFNATDDVKLEDPIKDHIIYTDDITYLKNQEKIFTKGKTKTIIEKKYKFYSKDTLYLKNKKILSSSMESFLTDDDSKLYKFDQFEYQINQDLLKGKNVKIISENFLQNGFSDEVNFTDGFFNLKKNNFRASFTEINLKKETYGNIKNDPRLIGASSSRDGNILTINKGIFTSCSKSMSCPAWSIKANKIKHDQEKKRLIYDNAILKVYNMPVMYMPKFFHPDPSVKRQSGFLQPLLNSSETLTDSIYIPYFHVISDNKDLTFQTTFFEQDDRILFQNEYRQANKNSDFIADMGYVTKYKAFKNTNKNSMSHFFAKYIANLQIKNFNTSTLDAYIEKTSSDTYLGIFENNLVNNTKIIPSGNTLTSGVNLILDNDEHQFSAGFEIYESLKDQKSSDRYQFTLPYYGYSRTPLIFPHATVDFGSSGYSNLTETNKLTSKIINNLNYNSFDFFTNIGLKNNYNIYLKNINSIGKKNSEYKSSAQIKLVNITEANSALPLIKQTEKNNNYLIPKISFRFNPSSMRDQSAKDRGIDVSNIFNIDRMNIGDSFEPGKSLTLGIDYKRENIDEINKYFELKLGTILRDRNEDRIPKSSTINRTTSNLFGSIENNFGEYLNLKYDFSLDNDFHTFDYNSVAANLKLENFETSFVFTEENGERGDGNVWSNETSFNIDEIHYLTFGTRRNRKISLTEYYDLVYEYRNDCLKAGFKYKKTYYEDRDIKPKEDLLFTITIIPLTTYEYKVDQELYRSGKNSVDDQIKRLFN